MDSIEEFLSPVNLPDDILQNFRSNGICVTHLPHLSEENLKELCPVMGLRIDLKNKIREYVDAQAKTETVTADSETIVVTENSENVLTGFDSDNISFTIVDLFTSKSSFPDFDLKTLLETSPCGKSILQYYTVNGYLDTKRRNRLTDIVIKHLYTYIVNKRLTCDDYNVIAGKIITQFPKESAATYFTRPIKKRDCVRGISISARGKLVDKVRNLLFESGERKRKHDEVPNSNQPLKKPAYPQEQSLELFQEDIDWLHTHDDPWSEVTTKWTRTAKARHSKEYNNIEDFISQWSILNNPKSVELIEEDFNFLYPDKGQNFSKNWHSFFENFLKIKKGDVDADGYKEALNSSLKYLDLEDQKIPSQLTLLVHIVPPKGRYSKKKKFSIQECLDSIIAIVENPGDIGSTVEKKKKEALSKKEPVQPYLILLGSLQNVRQLYLVIDRIRYTFNSVSQAFDVLFKCYHVFNAKYPKVSDHIFLIIQRCVYEITTNYDDPVPYIADILKLKK